MEITRKDPFTGETNTHHLNITGDEMALWEKGNTYIQDAFPRLSADEREFVKTGINIGTFDALFEDEDEDEDEDVSDDEYLRIKSGEGRDMYDEIEDDGDEDEEDDCPEFDEMMRLAKNTGCKVMLCMIAMGDNNHDYGLALKALIAKGFYTPENS